jgi:MoaA/NifB/PqqE/SkfB family radical SAM enzyme
MDTVFLIVTNRCTRSCQFCFYSTGYLTHPDVEMDGDQLCAAIERIRAMGARRLIITGGEPLLRPELPVVIRKANKVGMGSMLLTNADLLDATAARAIRRCGLHALSVSVNDPDDARRFDEMATILREPPTVRLTVTIVINRKNVKHLRALYRWAKGMGIATIFQPAFVPPASKEFDSLSPHRFSGREWVDIAALLTEWGGMSDSAAYVGFILGIYGRGRSSRPVRCGMGSAACVVDCDGSVYPCFHRRDIIAGDILRDTPADVVRELRSSAVRVSDASCYGEHCVSLFIGY